MEYVLLRLPTKEIVIINNSTKIGKSKVERFCNEGARLAGKIESDLNILQLESGLRYKTQKKYEDAIDKLYAIKRFVGEI